MPILIEQARVYTMGRRSNVRGWFVDVQPPELENWSSGSRHASLDEGREV